MPFQPGELAGDYQVLDVLGKGGMGRVYRVRNVISDRIEAMKVLLEDIGAEGEIAERFIAEIRTLARLDHPNIAKLHTAFKVDKQLVMVMEFVEGVDLADRAREASIPVYKVLGYMQQVLAALSYAHNCGVVHRDIKPSNIMITPQGGVKLMDFGIAKSNAEPLLTVPGTTLGSLLYMSPEQVRGTPVDARSDLYSVGIVLYELTAGRRPFESDSTYGILDAQLNTTPPPPIEINPSLPSALNEVILTALQKDPALRFQNAEAFRKVLESVAGTEAADATRVISETERPIATTVRSTAAAVPPVYAAAPAAVQPQAQKKPGRRSLWMAAGAVACLCVIAAAVIAVPHFRKSSAASSTAPGSSARAFNAPPPASAGASQSPSGSADVLPQSSSAASPQDQAAANSVGSDAKDVPVNSTPVRKPKRSAEEASVKALPAPDGGSQEAHPTANAAAAPPPPPPAAPAPAGPSEQDLNNASEALMKMQARAEAVHQSLANLKRQQAADGYGLRSDIVASEGRMGSYLQMAERQLQSRNLDGAQHNMERAEEELMKLEKFLGR